MKIKIPKENRDLRAAVRNRILRQSFLCFFWTLAVFLLAWFTRTVDSPLALLLYIAVCLFPFVKCRIWRWFFDRPFEGEVIKREEKQRVESTRPFHVTIESLTRVFDQQLVIRQKNGKLKIHTVSRRNDELVPNYREGDLSVITTEPNPLRPLPIGRTHPVSA